MSPFTALILCSAAVAIGFFAATLCTAANDGDYAEVWQQGREYGHAEIEAARRRAVELRPVATMHVDPAPFDWDRAEVEQAKHAHPSNWAEGHADRGPWPA